MQIALCLTCDCENSLIWLVRLFKQVPSWWGAVPACYQMFVLAVPNDALAISLIPQHFPSLFLSYIVHTYNISILSNFQPTTV